MSTNVPMVSSYEQLYEIGIARKLMVGDIIINHSQHCHGHDINDLCIYVGNDFYVPVKDGDKFVFNIQIGD